MTVITNVISRLPVILGEYDSTKVYGRKNRVIQYTCELESKVDNNTFVPITWDGAETFTLDEVHWTLISGNPMNYILQQAKPATTGSTGDYPYNGMGRVVLAKNMVGGVNTLTQDMFFKGEIGSRVPNTNTVFVIQYDFVLGENVTIPAGCVLEFEGGSISGGDLTLENNCKVVNGDFNAFGKLTIGSNCCIENSVFDGLVSNGAVIYGNNITNFTINGSKIVVNSNNQNTDVSGIKITSGANIKVSNCIFTGSKNENYATELSSPLLVLDSTNVSVVGCTLTESEKEGLFVAGGSKILFEGNVCYNAGYSGIAMGGCTDVIVNGNLVYNTGASCISTNCENQVISNNVVHNNRTGNGITTGHAMGDDSNTRTCIVVGNLIENCHNFGISVAQPKELVIANNIIKNLTAYPSDSQHQADGINIQPSIDDTPTTKRIVIEGNVIENVYRGISIPIYKLSAGKMNVSICNNSISNGYSTNGIFAYADIIEIHDNRFTDAGTDHSMTLSASEINIYNNKFNKNITIIGNNCNCYIENNIFFMNVSTGERVVTLRPFESGEEIRSSAGASLVFRGNSGDKKGNIFIEALADFFDTSKTNLVYVEKNILNTDNRYVDSADVVVSLPSAFYSQISCKFKFIENYLDKLLFPFHPISTDSYKPKLENKERGYKVYVNDTNKMLRWDGNSTWTEVDG